MASDRKKLGILGVAIVTLALFASLRSGGLEGRAVGTNPSDQLELLANTDSPIPRYPYQTDGLVVKLIDTTMIVAEAKDDEGAVADPRILVQVCTVIPHASEIELVVHSPQGFADSPPGGVPTDDALVAQPGADGHSRRIHLSHGDRCQAASDAECNPGQPRVCQLVALAGLAVAPTGSRVRFEISARPVAGDEVRVLGPGPQEEATIETVDLSEMLEANLTVILWWPEDERPDSDHGLPFRPSYSNYEDVRFSTRIRTAVGDAEAHLMTDPEHVTISDYRAQADIDLPGLFLPSMEDSLGYHLSREELGQIIAGGRQRGFINVPKASGRVYAVRAFVSSPTLADAESHAFFASDPDSDVRYRLRKFLARTRKRTKAFLRTSHTASKSY